MKINFLNLNIYKGRSIDAVTAFVKNNNIDIATFQEVAGGKLSFEDLDCFEYLRRALPDYNNEIVIRYRTANHNSYFANATFFKKSFNLKTKNVVWMKPYKEIADPKTHKIEDDPTACLTLTLEKNDIKFQVLNTHLAWSKSAKDDPNKIEQGKKLIEYVDTLSGPFILAGDFNVDKSSIIVSSLDRLARNLITENNITNTLNPRTHRAKNIFPKGHAVDFIYTENSIKADSFQLLDKLDLSDHFGLLATLEI